MKGILFSPAMVRAILENRKVETRRVIMHRRRKGAKLEPIGTLMNGVVDPPLAIEQCSFDGSFIGWHGQPHPTGWETDRWYPKGGGFFPKYRVGERIYVKETWQIVGDPGAEPCDRKNIVYRADYPNCVDKSFENVPPIEEMKWRSSLFMPEWAARIHLTITGVAAERLHDITEDGALREGTKASDAAVVCSTVTGRAKVDAELSNTARGAYAALWDSINGKSPGKGWKDNPWVWVYRFEKESKP